MLELFQRPLVLVAHQDDESIACGLLLQRSQDPCVVFATDGAPEDPYFWASYGSRDRLAKVRRREAEQAMRACGVRHLHFLGLIDQQLHRHLHDAFLQLIRISMEHRCSCIVTHAYEGGHPDHDSCSYLGFHLGKKIGTEVWEMPMYHRAGGRSTVQAFVEGEAEVVVEPIPAELARKNQMILQYVSQGNLLAGFPLPQERFRRQPPYQYGQPPHSGTLNYEAWKWQVTGNEVSQAFTECQNLGR